MHRKSRGRGGSAPDRGRPPSDGDSASDWRQAEVKTVRRLRSERPGGGPPLQDPHGQCRDKAREAVRESHGGDKMAVRSVLRERSHRGSDVSSQWIRDW